MPTRIFVNLPVRDLEKSKEFFGKLGYGFDARFTDQNAACLVISDEIYAMLLTHQMWARFTPKEVADPSKSAEVMIALTCESRKQVDELVRKAVTAGGRTSRDPEDHGFMYAHAFEDLDGHIWEPFWMDPAAVKPE